MGEWKIHIYRKDVYLAFCSWHFETSQISNPATNKATVGVCAICLCSCFIFAGQRGIQVVHIGVGFCVARSDRVGNAKASKCRMSNRYRFPRFFFIYVSQFLI